VKILTKNGKIQHSGISKACLYLAAVKSRLFMNHLMLSALYDTVDKSVGPTLAGVFFLLLCIEMIYVMAKYLGSSDK
jgi:hypothetical protein